jgi:hypothetical protein
MLNFSDYKILENFTLKYMAFDWDDNILFMSTVIHMQKKVDGKWVDEDVSTEKFAQIRAKKDWRIKDNNPPVGFSEFRDFGPRGENAFIEDVKEAIAKKDFGPSWNQFIKSLTRGNIFAIITARGHESITIRKAVEYIIETQLNVDQKNEMAANLMAYDHMFTNSDPLENKTFGELLDVYLDSCDFVGITSPGFEKETGFVADSANPEVGKEIAMKRFVRKIHQYGKQVGGDIKFGFSDDDRGTLDHINKFFKNELSLQYVMDYNVFDTSDPELEGGYRVEESVRTYSEFNGISKKEWFRPENL